MGNTLQGLQKVEILMFWVSVASVVLIEMLF